jgi:hypothetical protein
MSGEVEIRACTEIEGTVVWTSLESADFFGVYVGQSGEFVWAADFAHYQDAYNWAEEVAEMHELTIQDRCYREN